MGALLLLLFIMDRRAKIAAQHTASEVVAERKKRTQDEEDARLAEWQKAKDQLHQSLLDQHQQVLGDAKGWQEKLDSANQKLVIVTTEHLDLNKKADREAQQIAFLQTQIAGQRNGLKEADRKEGKVKAELLEAAKELAELQRAFLALRALKENEKQVYSVVPYRGKRGEIRAPIYVECVRFGVVFHPEKKMLEGLSFTPDAIKAEVERRTGTLAVEKSVKEKSRTIAAERKGPYVLFLIRPEGIESYYKAQAGLKGYDLDFGYELVDQNWVLDFNGDPNAKPAPPIAFAKASEPRKQGVTPFPTLANGGTGQGGTGSGSPSPSIGGPSSKNVGSLEPKNVGLNPPPNLGLGNAGGPALPPLPGPSGGGMETGAPNKGPAFVPIARPSPTVPIAAGAKSESGLPSIGIPIPGQNVVGTTGGAATPKQPGGDNPPGDSRIKPALSFGADDAKKPAPPPPSRVLGNRDFVITIDCYSDHATVFPGGMQYRWSGMNANANDQALVQTVTNLIAKRQASVRPGEPPYRPMIRFQVSADGLRTYLRVYPLLEHLRVAMTRENVED